jgi:hypothetical protein
MKDILKSTLQVDPNERPKIKELLATIEEKIQRIKKNKK